MRTFAWCLGREFGPKFVNGLLWRLIFGPTFGLHRGGGWPARRARRGCLARIRARRVVVNGHGVVIVCAICLQLSVLVRTWRKNVDEVEREAAGACFCELPVGPTAALRLRLCALPIKVVSSMILLMKDVQLSASNRQPMRFAVPMQSWSYCDQGSERHGLPSCISAGA